MCLDETGTVTLERVATLLGVAQDTARTQLDQLVYDEPGTDRLVPAAEYLSGNVRDKIAACRADDGADRYRANIEALQRVLPRQLEPGEITARLGSPWIPSRDVEAFCREILDATVDVEHLHQLGQWSARLRDGSRRSVALTSEWGTARADAITLLDASLNQRLHTVSDPAENGRRVRNDAETLAARDKQEALTSRFAAWVWEDPDRSTRLAERYNELFSSVVLPDHDGSHLTLPGLAGSFSPRPHQRAAVARVLTDGRTLLAHAVGAGKTATMVMAAMELRRLGSVTKPAVVVPNHMLEQFSREWLQLYPTARILVADKEKLSKARRKEFVARAATGDWDGIVFTHSGFGRVPLGGGLMADYLHQEIETARSALAGSQDGKGLSVKRLERRIAQMEESYKRLLAEHAKDDGVRFEETGIDYLFVDEAHAFKNRRVDSSIDGVANGGSQRAQDLDAKLWALRRAHGPRVVTFATATPVANSMAELWVMQTYLDPDLLSDVGLRPFDAGCHIRTNPHCPRAGSRRCVLPDADPLRPVPERPRTAHPLPAGSRRPYPRRPRPPHAVHRRWPGRDRCGRPQRRAHRVRGRSRQPSRADPQPIGRPGRRQHAQGHRRRPARCARHAPRRARRAHQRRQARRSCPTHCRHPPLDKGPPLRRRARPAHRSPRRPARLQLRVLRRLHPSRRRPLERHDELRALLVRRGVDTESIRYMQAAQTDQGKAKLFAACRDGSVSVLIGSTETMGVGTNVQTRAIAMHHLDAPWRPADIEQRDGRILRQGNQNAEVRVIRYVTEGSFDTYMWQTLERKAAFISQVTRGDLPDRDVDDIGDQALSFAEVKALATGDPLVLEKAAVDADVARLSRLERAHHDDQHRLHRTHDTATVRAERAEERASQLEDVLDQITDTRGDKFALTVDGHRHTKRVDAGQHIQRLLVEQLDRTPPDSTGPAIEIGMLGGLRFTGQAITTIEDEVRLAVPDAYIEVTYPALDLKRSEPSSVITRLERQIQRLPDVAAAHRTEAASARSEAERAESRLGSTWDRADELTALRRRQQEINEQLAEAASPEAPAEPADDPTVEPVPSEAVSKAMARLDAVQNRPRPDSGLSL